MSAFMFLFRQMLFGFYFHKAHLLLIFLFVCIFLQHIMFIPYYFSGLFLYSTFIIEELH